MEYTHNAWLVAASLSVALMAGFSGLSLTRGISALPVAHRKAVVVIAAVVLGGGIWSMHFIAMLGLQLPILFFYDALITLLSALVAILMVGMALLILHFVPRTPVTLTLAGAIVGLGITVMHYVGMLGMEMCRPVFAPLGVAVAFLGAIALSVLAIWVAYGARTKGNILLGTLCFGLSVFAVHFVAMAGTGFEALEVLAQDTPSTGGGPAISNAVLAMGVAVTAFVISGSFLLTGVSFLAPSESGPSDQGPSLKSPPAVASESPLENPLALHDPPVDPAPPPTVTEAPVAVAPVPFEKDGRTQFIERAAIAAVRAEGHYTVLYAGSDKLFCPWSISEATTRLAPSHFIRAHRSYLINPAHVTGFQRQKDTGVCFFENVDALAKVPVSRSRLAEVRRALGV